MACPMFNSAEMRHRREQSPQIFVVQPVPGIDLQAETRSQLGGGAEPREFRGAQRTPRRRIRECAGVELDDRRAQFHGGAHLRLVRIDEQTHPRSGGVKLRHRRREPVAQPGGVEAALRRDFQAVFRHQADVRGPQRECDRHDLRRVAELEVELCFDHFLQAREIGILHVPAIGAQMHGDPARARPFARQSSGDEIRLDVMGRGRLRVARLPQGGDVVDIDAERGAVIFHRFARIPAPRLNAGNAAAR